MVSVSSKFPFPSDLDIHFISILLETFRANLTPNFSRVFRDFSKPEMTESPVLHNHEEHKTKYSVSRTSTWAWFVLHELSYFWQGTSAGKKEGPGVFAPVSLYWIFTWIN